MYISQRTIEKVQQSAEILNIVKKYVDLRKTGKSYQALCPFHNEKTPSFFVIPEKNIYKCFGCGRAGDPIQFIREKENLAFYESIKHLAELYSIEIEYEKKEVNMEKVDALKQMQKLVAAAAQKYFENWLDTFVPDENNPPEHIAELWIKRNLSFETIIQFQLGYAPNEWKFLTPSLIDNGYYTPALHLGLIRTKNENNYDFFRDRIMIPIHDENGIIIGFGARKLRTDKNKENPKYLNSIESDLYKKEQVLYGLHFAKQGIRKAKKAIIVEGYFDVVSLHQNGLDNAVAPCGTALSVSQAKLLKRHTDHVILIFDGDEAGKKNGLKTIDVCIEIGFKVEVFLLPLKLKDGENDEEKEDPDSFCRNFLRYVSPVADGTTDHLKRTPLKEQVYNNVRDAVEYKIDNLLNLAVDADSKEIALKNVSRLLALIKGDFKREHYMEYIQKQHKIKVKQVRKSLSEITKTDVEEKEIVLGEAITFIPKEAFKEEGNDPVFDMEEYGFFEMNRQYWTMASTGNGYKAVPFSNFTMRVLFHLENEKIPRRLIEVINTKGKKKTLDTPTMNLTSLGKFKEFVEGAGNYLFEGDQAKLNKLKRKLFEQEKDCKQIEVLGWHNDGFWVFSNCLITDEVIPLDSNGIAEFKNANYYVPSGNHTHANNPQKFSNEKKFKHIESKILFADWARAFYQVYGNPGMIGLCYTISCIFSDIIFSVVNGFPMMFLYGEGGSGKGSLIKSIQHLFGRPQDPLTLSGKANTDKAKIAIFAQYVNAVICLEEYKNNNEDIVNLLKALWDRYGYTRRKIDSGVGTESVPISSGVIVTGNEYPVDDPLLQRLLIEEINDNARGQEAIDNYHYLKELEEKGITSVLLELLQLRKVFEDTYKEKHIETFKEVSKLLQDVKVTDRMKSNLTVLVTTYKIASLHLKFPFEKEQLLEYAKQSMIKQNEKRDTGGEVQKFWDVVLYLLNDRKITHGKEFKINGNEIQIRYKEIHALYSLAHVQMHRVPGLSNATLLDKLKKSDAYIGSKDSALFHGKKTSCHQFDYSKISVDLLSIINYTNLESSYKNGPNPEYLPPFIPGKNEDPGYHST